MLIALVTRSLVVGAYLVGIGVSGRFDAVAVLLAVAVVLIWAAPLVRDAVRRNRAAQNPPSAATP